jgi:hypothetical protein
LEEKVAAPVAKAKTLSQHDETVKLKSQLLLSSLHKISEKVNTSYINDNTWVAARYKARESATVVVALWRPAVRDQLVHQNIANFFNPILFAICTSTFTKLCKNMYTVACRRVLSSTPL